MDVKIKIGKIALRFLKYILTGLLDTSIVIKIINDYRTATNATVIIISHSMEDMAVMADKLLVLSKGEVVMFDKTEKVFLQGDKLREIGLNVPIVTRVFDALRQKGIDLPNDVFTVERAVEVLKQIKAGDRNA